MPVSRPRTVKAGLVGLGKIARDQHLPTITKLQGIDLVAVSSRNAELPDCSVFKTMDDMLDAMPEIDAVIMCQPPQARFAAAKCAIERGKHVFLEKPPGATLSEVEALAQLGRANGCTLFASWHSREAAGVRKACEWLSNARIASVAIEWKEDARIWHPGQDWIWRAGGFGVFDPGINALSILTILLPETVLLISADLCIPSNCAAPIAAELSMETVGRIPIAASFDFRQTGPQTWNIGVKSDLGELLLSHGGNLLSIDGHAVQCGVPDEYLGLYRRFLGLIERGESEVDAAPLRLVADSFLRGEVSRVEPFFP